MRYREYFEKRQFSGIVLPPDNGFFFRFVLRTTIDPAELIEKFGRDGVAVRRGVDKLLHKEAGLCDKGFPNSIKLFDSSISLPFYPNLTDDEFNRVISVCEQVFMEYCNAR